MEPSRDSWCLHVLGHIRRGHHEPAASRTDDGRRGMIGLALELTREPYRFSRVGRSAGGRASYAWRESKERTQERQVSTAIILCVPYRISGFIQVDCPFMELCRDTVARALRVQLC